MRQWNEIDKEKTDRIVRAVSKGREGALFISGMTGGQVAKLPFYRNYHLYRLTSFSTMPAFSFEYLGDGQRFHYLDGSPKPMAAVSAKNDLFLNESNVLDYIDFFFRYIHNEDGDLLLLRDPHDHPGLDSLPEDKMAEIMAHHKAPEVSFDDDDKKFHVTATLDNDGTLVQARIAVTTNGLVSITDQKMLRAA